MTLTIISGVWEFASITDETGASKLPSETQNIWLGPIPEKANQNMAIGNPIVCDNSVKYFPDVLEIRALEHFDVSLQM